MKSRFWRWCLSAFCITRPTQVTGAHKMWHRNASRIIFPYVLATDKPIRSESKRRFQQLPYDFSTPNHFFFHLHNHNSTRSTSHSTQDTHISFRHIAWRSTKQSEAKQLPGSKHKLRWWFRNGRSHHNCSQSYRAKRFLGKSTYYLVIRIVFQNNCETSSFDRSETSVKGSKRTNQNTFLMQEARQVIG